MPNAAIRRASPLSGVVLLLSLLCLLPTPGGAQAPCGKQALAGTWQVRTLTVDGKPSTDGEMMGATMTFTGDQLTIVTRPGPRLGFAVKVEEASRPCAFHLTPMPPSGEPSGWMLFAVDGDSLTLGFHDNLTRRARAFDARPDMVVLTLARQLSRRPAG